MISRISQLRAEEAGMVRFVRPFYLLIAALQISIGCVALAQGLTTMLACLIAAALVLGRYGALRLLASGKQAPAVRILILGGWLLCFFGLLAEVAIIARFEPSMIPWALAEAFAGPALLTLASFVLALRSLLLVKNTP